MRRTKPTHTMRPRVGAAELKLLTFSACLALHCNNPSATLPANDGVRCSRNRLPEQDHRFDLQTTRGTHRYEERLIPSRHRDHSGHRIVGIVRLCAEEIR